MLVWLEHRDNMKGRSDKAGKMKEAKMYGALQAQVKILPFIIRVLGSRVGTSSDLPKIKFQLQSRKWKFREVDAG